MPHACASHASPVDRYRHTADAGGRFAVLPRGASTARTRNVIACGSPTFRFLLRHPESC
jgi:hypothetical protein